MTKIDTSPEAIAALLEGVTPGAFDPTAVDIPPDEPRQIVCTGEEGSDIWQPAFGTWSYDDFGISSDEPVGDGERLFVNRRIYDALAAERDAMRAQVAELEGERDSFRAVLEGARYGDIPSIANNTPEQSRALGEAVMHLTIDATNRALRYRHVLEGVKGAIDTGRNEPLQIWRDQITIALDDLALKGGAE
jgi:hypothetical protein